MEFCKFLESSWIRLIITRLLPYRHDIVALGTRVIKGTARGIAWRIGNCWMIARRQNGVHQTEIGLCSRKEVIPRQALRGSNYLVMV